jgi:hypothetical protein
MLANALRCRLTMTRRPVACLLALSTFLLSSAGAGQISAQLTSANGTRRITLGVIEPAAWKREASSTGSMRGTTLGIEEAQRTAAMFGWDLVVVRLADSLGAAAAIRELTRDDLTGVTGNLSGVRLEPRESGPAPVVFDIGRSGDAPLDKGLDVRFHVLPPLDSVLAWHPSLVRYGAGQLNERYRRRFGAEMDEPAWAAWIAVKILVDAVLKTGSNDPRALELFLLDGARFDGHKGVPLFFDRRKRELVQPLYSLSGESEAP